ncbi:MAG: regulatory protein RecX [Terriglobales bacterium]
MPFGRARKLDNEAELYEYAVGALARRMRSVAELKRLLRRRVEPDELGDALVELVIAKLKEQRYLNDTQYAATYSSLRRENDKLGRRRVISDLKSRGVHDDIIQKAVGGTYDGINEEQLARDYLRRKRLQKPANDKQAARIFRAMVRAGFGTRTIFAILKKWNVDDEFLTALETEEP